MKAMVLTRHCQVGNSSAPLELADLPIPEPGVGEILIRVAACGVCHTELDEIEGRTPPPKLPVVPGHQVVGRVAAVGPDVKRLKPGDRVGAAWVFSTCGKCLYCLSGRENLCPMFRATGRDADGGYAEYMAIAEAFTFPIPDLFSDAEAAPFLCAGAIGYRSLRLTGLCNGQRLGLTGFGASGHLVLKLARFLFPGSPVYVFARSETERLFARELGANWAGNTQEEPPDLLDCIIDTTPAWTPVTAALRCLTPGGRLVINAIRKENSDLSVLQKVNYSEHLWMEKEIKSVANITRTDVLEFLDTASRVPIFPDIQTYALCDANRALEDLKARQVHGAKVLLVD